MIINDSKLKINWDCGSSKFSGSPLRLRMDEFCHMVVVLSALNPSSWARSRKPCCLSQYLFTRYRSIICYAYTSIVWALYLKYSISDFWCFFHSKISLSRFCALFWNSCFPSWSSDKMIRSRDCTYLYRQWPSPLLRPLSPVHTVVHRRNMGLRWWRIVGDVDWWRDDFLLSEFWDRLRFTARRLRLTARSAEICWFYWFGLSI